MSHVEITHEVLRGLAEMFLAKFDEGSSGTDDTDPEPRTWNDLRDVPDGVTAVEDREGYIAIRMQRTAPHGWKWVQGLSLSQEHLTKFAPYTEVQV